MSRAQNKILLLVDRPGNRRLLADELSVEHEIVEANADDAIEEPFDLAVVDEAALGPIADRLDARKERARPVHLPIVLVATAETVDRIPRRLQRVFDDILVTPVERAVLRARVNNLLLTRVLSQDLLKRAEEAERASRIRDEVLAVVAHDLRNPLNTITGSAELLRLPLAKEQHDRQIEMIRRTADRMNRLIQDLLQVAMIEAGRLELDATAVDAAELAAEACDAERGRAEAKRLTLECESAPGLPPVRADHDLLHRVLMNLVGNAIKFTPSDGRVTVRVAAAEAERVRFSVSDTGPGIPAEELPQLFGRFWQAERDRRDGDGAGLGLAIAKGIVEGHGGEIWAESRIGAGSTFHFTVPVWSNP